MTLGLSHGEWMELPFLLFLLGLSDPRIAELCEMPALNCTAKPKSPAVWACLGVDPLDMHRIPYQASGGNNLPCPITTTLTSSSVHHSSHQLSTTFLSYYNVTWKTICAEKWRKAMIYYYYLVVLLINPCGRDVNIPGYLLSKGIPPFMFTKIPRHEWFSTYFFP